MQNAPHNTAKRRHGRAGSKGSTQEKEYCAACNGAVRVRHSSETTNCVQGTNSRQRPSHNLQANYNQQQRSTANAQTVGCSSAVHLAADCNSNMCCCCCCCCTTIQLQRVRGNTTCQQGATKHLFVRTSSMKVASPHPSSPCPQISCRELQHGSQSILQLATLATRCESERERDTDVLCDASTPLPHIQPLS